MTSTRSVCCGDIRSASVLPVLRRTIAVQSCSRGAQPPEDSAGEPRCRLAAWPISRGRKMTRPVVRPIASPKRHQFVQGRLQAAWADREVRLLACCHGSVSRPWPSTRGSSARPVRDRKSSRSGPDFVVVYRKSASRRSLARLLPAIALHRRRRSRPTPPASAARVEPAPAMSRSVSREEMSRSSVRSRASSLRPRPAPFPCRAVPGLRGSGSPLPRPAPNFGSSVSGMPEVAPALAPSSDRRAVAARDP